jgi:hypothetical protein
LCVSIGVLAEEKEEEEEEVLEEEEEEELEGPVFHLFQSML